MLCAKTVNVRFPPHSFALTTPENFTGIFLFQSILLNFHRIHHVHVNSTYVICLYILKTFFLPYYSLYNMYRVIYLHNIIAPWRSNASSKIIFFILVSCFYPFKKTKKYIIHTMYEHTPLSYLFFTISFY